MTAGVRIQHPTERNCVFTLVDASRPYREPYFCVACAGTEGAVDRHIGGRLLRGKVHRFKTYHINLDETGAAIVSQEIVDRLKRLPVQPFAIANEVKRPPAQRLALDGTVTVPRVVVSPQLGEPV